MLKKIALLLMICMLAFQLPNLASAQSYSQIWVDGQKLSLSQAPVIVNSTTFIPVTVVLKKMGLTVELEPGDTIKASKKGIVMKMKAGSKIANVNGITVILDEPIKAINGTTMAPLRFITDSLGATVSINGSTISLSNANKATMYTFGDLPILISGDYARNLNNKSYLDLKIVDFFYNPASGEIQDIDYLSNVIGFEAKSTKKYNTNNMEVGNTTYLNNYVYIGSVVKSLEDYDNNVLMNSNYSKVRSYYYSQSYLSKVAPIIQANKGSAETDLKNELKANNNVPLKVTNATISYDVLGYPEVNLTVKNLTTKTVIAYEMNLRLYDDFDRSVNWAGSNLFKGISQGNYIKSGQSQTDTWDLYLYDLTTQAKHIKITAVKFSDGSSWKA
ncbi:MULTISPECIES: copper amine oxidase N-terminal domain-containing protein [Paenibacillus]|uniref:copper amine oxidase N-terminal domain-containing protein n=1 Tax=Paenibacillus TaxID=44249 RepID=UPI000FD868C9|nr:MULTISPECIES: copper amine oxidase N-terminal domain-containing protein [Paenibacillus]MCK9861503.1 copper amine oxidase N-terminal domain-containing protein [Paenibacillus sp. ATY16]